MKSDFRFKDGAEHEAVSAREGYDRWSKIYDAEDNALIALDTPMVEALVGDVRNLDLADLGCGSGRHSLRLAARGARVTGLDFSEGMLGLARAKPGAERIRFVQHDLARPLPLADASFDVVLSALVLDHIVDPEAFFRECRRICRPAGAVVLSTMHPAMMLRGIVAHFRDPTTGRDVLPASAPNTIADYVMAASRAGFRFEHFAEHVADEALAQRSGKALKFIGWPLLLTMKLR